MRVLVDYDNLPPTIRGQGPVPLADKLFELVRGYLSAGERIDIRLYGGWFAEDKLTKSAQNLQAALNANFPYPLWIREATGSGMVPVTAVLAHSLERLPKKLLYHTYRERPPARRMKCENPADHACTGIPCPLSPLPAFVNTDRCSILGCPVTPRHLFRAAGGQKLVDTMVVADLVHLGRIEKRIAVVSSDDDVWPGIISALVEGIHLIHILTGSTTSGLSYVDGVPGTYTSLSL